MSSPILPIPGPLGPAPSVPPATSVGGEIHTYASLPDARERVPVVEASRGGPPPEVLEQIARARELHGRMREAGAELRFSPAHEGAPLTIEFCHDGAPVRTVTVAEAFAIAAGHPAD